MGLSYIQILIHVTSITVIIWVVTAIFSYEWWIHLVQTHRMYSYYIVQPIRKYQGCVLSCILYIRHSGYSVRSIVLFADTADSFIKFHYV